MMVWWIMSCRIMIHHIVFLTNSVYTESVEIVWTVCIQCDTTVIFCKSLMLVQLHSIKVCMNEVFSIVFSSRASIQVKHRLEATPSSYLIVRFYLTYSGVHSQAEISVEFCFKKIMFLAVAAQFRGIFTALNIYLYVCITLMIFVWCVYIYWMELSELHSILYFCIFTCFSPFIIRVKESWV